MGRNSSSITGQNQKDQQIINNLFPPVQDESNEVFALSHQKSLFVELLKVLAFVMTKEPVEYLLFLIPFLKNYTIEEIIEKLEINYQMFSLLDQDNENILGEVDQLYKLLASKEDIKAFIKTHGLSKKFFDYTLKSIIISKNLIIQSYFKEAYYSTKYDLSDMNTNKIFTSKKIYHVYFIQKKSNKIPSLKNINKVEKVVSVKNFIKKLNQEGQPIIVKSFFKFSFLNQGQWISNLVTIKGVNYYQVVVCKELIEEKINNTIFNFMEIKFKSSMDTHTLENILQPINQISTKEIFLFINKIFQTYDLTHIKFETFYDQTVESVINNPEILDIVVNFGPKKYLLVHHDNSYILYLIFNVNTISKTALNIKPMKYIMDYILKNLS